MTDFLIDSDVFADFFQNRTYARKLIAGLSKQGSIFISVLTTAELRAGWTPKQAILFLPDLRKLTSPIPVSEDIAELAGELRHKYKLKGMNLSTVDTIIAATALTQHCQLVTRNIRDYPMPEIRLYSINSPLPP